MVHKLTPSRLRLGGHAYPAHDTLNRQPAIHDTGKTVLLTQHEIPASGYCYYISKKNIMVFLSSPVKVSTRFQNAPIKP